LSAKNSMAVWCENQIENSDSHVEFHFNLWRFGEDSKFDIWRWSKDVNGEMFRKRNVRDDLLEVGVMVDDPKKIKCIKIFFPHVVDRKDISDCGNHFANDKIAHGIFNEPLSKNVVAGDKCVALLKGKDPFCDVHLFTKDKGLIDDGELEIREADGGSIVCITEVALTSLRTQLLHDARGYFRLRLKLPSGTANPYVNSIEPGDKHWNSSIEHIDYIDFRLNETRTLPVKVSQEMKAAQAGLAKIKLVAFLTAIPVISAVASSHEHWRKSRLLEHDVWKDYVEGNVPEGMVVYHWRKKAREDQGKDKENQYVEDFSAFVKLHTRKTGGKILRSYVMVAFLFGILGNLSATWTEPSISGFAKSGWKYVFGGSVTDEPSNTILDAQPPTAAIEENG